MLLWVRGPLPSLVGSRKSLYPEIWQQLLLAVSQLLLPSAKACLERAAF